MDMKGLMIALPLATLAVGALALIMTLSMMS